MAIIASVNQSRLSYAIRYGFLGGPWHARKLRRLLHQNGYTRARTIQQADIIIVHSAGSWLIPPTIRPQLILFIGMPLAQLTPAKTLLLANLKGLKISPLQSASIGLKSVLYAMTQPRRNLKIMRIAKTAKPVLYSGPRIIFIANQHDPWVRGELLQHFLQREPWAFISLPGSHDDIWKNASSYVAIIKHYEPELLAQANNY